MTLKMSSGKSARQATRRGSRNMDDGPRRPRCFTAPIEAAEFLREKALKRVQWGVRRQRGISDIGLLCTRKNCSTTNCEPRGALVDAQNIINKAMSEDSAAMRSRLAKAALKFSYLCVDAHLTLFYEELAVRGPDVVNHCFNAVRAGLDILGASTLQDPNTQFFADPKTRPWMRAMFALGEFYRETEPEKTIEIWMKIMACDPSDGLNIRRALIPALIEQNHLCNAAELIERFLPEGSTSLALSAVLYYWKELGPSAITELAMWEAFATNPHILDVLFSQSAEFRRVGSDNSEGAAPSRFFTPNSREDAEAFLTHEANSFGPNSKLGTWMLSVVDREAKTLEHKFSYPDSGVIV